MPEVNINKILREDGRNCSRGAPMGDVDHVEYLCANGVDTKGMPPLRCQRVYLIDGDYGPDGTYWGASTRSGYVYCAFNDGRDGDSYAPAMGVRIYVRAFTYEQAKREVQAKYPQAVFVRGGR
jgi:hypothetical protein